jgi:hypothetical protein
VSKAKQAKQPKPRPSLFLSHSRADAAWCDPFVLALRQKGYDVWYPEGEQQEGEARLEASQEQIRDRDVFIVIWSPNAYATPHIQDEILLALKAQRFIFSLVIGDIPTLGLLTVGRRLDVLGETLSEAVESANVWIEGFEGAWWYDGPTHVDNDLPLRIPLPVPEAFSSLWEPSEARLKTLGFVPTTLHGCQVILPPLRDISAGPFLMGSNENPEPIPLDSSDGPFYETPQFTRETPAFQMATYPLTVAEYACAVQAGVISIYHMQDWTTRLEQRLDHPARMNWALATV